MALIAVNSGVDLLGDSSSLPHNTGGDAPQNQETTKEPTTSPKSDQASDQTETNQAPSPSSVSPDDPPDPAFDELLPTLKQMTDAPIMLPANLPEELKYVAVDSGTTGDKYSVWFLNTENKTGEVTQQFVGAAVRGEISVEPSGPGPQFPDYGPGVKQMSLRKTTLPDGTEATLNYYDSETNVPFTVGGFVYQDPSSGQKYLYTVEIDRDSHRGDLIKQVLSSMVLVRGAQAGETTTTANDSGNGPVQQFVIDYYRAVDDQDWSKTYSMLDEASQERFTEAEWIERGSRPARRSPEHQRKLRR